MPDARTDPATLWKKTAARAAGSPGNLVSGAVSLAASAALWNPLPLILWGLGAASYVLYSTTSKSKLNETLERERAEAAGREEAVREAGRRALEMDLAEPPVADWIRRGLLPDYADGYRRLLEVRGKILRLAHERKEIEEVTEMGVQRQLTYMLGAYLQFVKARLTYLQILSTAQPARRAAGPPKPPIRFHGKVRGVVPPPIPEGDDDGLPRMEDLLEQLDGKIEELKRQAEREPASAQARQWHVEILTKQRALLVQCGERDQSVAAQLQAFPDAFNVILGQISASQVDAGELSSTMGSLVERVEQTERFVKALAPQMDQMLAGLGGAEPALS